MPEDTIKDDEYAPITRALREAMDSDGWATSGTYCVKLSADMDAFNALCDDIDAMHKSLERENAGMRDFCERVERATQARKDVTLWGTDYTALPVDADGVAIHVGDVMDWEYGGTFDVEGFGIEGLFYLDDARQLMWTNVRTKRHHREPTVEDVLREFVTEFNRDDTELCDDEIIERFAKRLQLAEVDE